MSAPALVLVRHGRPRIDPDQPPYTWPLCPEGRDACARLAEKVAAYAPTAIVSSPEPKARETADILAERLGLAVQVDGELHEHKRHHISFGTEAEFRERMARVFAEPKVRAPGGESAHEAHDRIARALARHEGHPLVAVTHGTVLSLYLAERLGLDAHDLWRSLHMPDAFVLDADGALVERLS